jgi:hypothetical protein
MGQVLHRGATTAEAIRRAIQHSQESLTARARRHQPQDGGQVVEALLDSRIQQSHLLFFCVKRAIAKQRG